MTKKKKKKKLREGKQSKKTIPFVLVVPVRHGTAHCGEKAKTRKKLWVFFQFD